MFWLGALVSLCYVPGYTGAYIATQWPVLAVVLSFGLLRSGPFTTLHAAGLLFVAYAAASITWSQAPYAGVFGLWLIIVMALSLWFGTTSTSKRELYAGLAVGASVSSVVAVFQHFGIQVVPSVTPTPAGIYVNGVQQAEILALIAVALATERMWLWIVPLVPGLWLAQSRGGLLALAAGALALYVRRLWVFATLGAVIAAYLLFKPLSDDDHLRMQIWGLAFHNLNWLGWGTGVFYTLLMVQDNGIPVFPEYAHNDALQLVFEYGIAAAIPLGIFAYALSRTKAKEWPIMVAFTVASSYSMPLFMPVTSFLALAAVGSVLRRDALAVSHGHRGGQHVVLGKVRGRRKSVSLEPHYSAKGR